MCRSDEPPPIRWEDQPLIERDAYRLTCSPNYRLFRDVLAALGRSDAIEAVERSAALVRERLAAGVFRY